MFDRLELVVLGVGGTPGLLTPQLACRPGVKSWPHHLTLPAAIPPGKAQWQIVWALKTLGPAGGSIHGATLKISQHGHSWRAHSKIWVVVPKR